MTRLSIIKHNVLTWDGSKFDLANTYRQFDPDIFIKSYGLTDDKKLNIPGFRVYQQSINGATMDGVAIAVKYTIPHRVKDDYLSEILALETDTSAEQVTIATFYLPPQTTLHPPPTSYDFYDDITLSSLQKTPTSDI